jgi:hypothetical protein
LAYDALWGSHGHDWVDFPLFPGLDEGVGCLAHGGGGWGGHFVVGSGLLGLVWVVRSGRVAVNGASSRGKGQMFGRWGVGQF